MENSSDMGSRNELPWHPAASVLSQCPAPGLAKGLRMRRVGTILWSKQLLQAEPKGPE
jgi:hypothetical protein